MVLLLPVWASVGIAATLDEVEQVVEARENAATWREAASSAGMEDRPRKYREWLRRFEQVMAATLPLLPGLKLGEGGGFVGKLRGVLGVVGRGVLVALRRLLYRAYAVVLAPLRLLRHDRASSRPPPSPR
ncbi:MAG: hypothetical protein QME96_09440 [Myxococcota bacterium]|nr:hypothetical protein [Myxococcota bacterium]